MTMIALARKVYAATARVTDNGWVFPNTGRGGQLFKPEENTAQLLDVLCWLMAQDKNNALHSDVLLYVVKDGTGWSKRAEYHGNTPQSLADAIFKAAVRVAGGEDESW